MTPAISLQTIQRIVANSGISCARCRRVLPDRRSLLASIPQALLSRTETAALFWKLRKGVVCHTCRNPDPAYHESYRRLVRYQSLHTIPGDNLRVNRGYPELDPRLAEEVDASDYLVGDLPTKPGFKWQRRHGVLRELHDQELKGMPIQDDTPLSPPPVIDDGQLVATFQFPSWDLLEYFLVHLVDLGTVEFPLYAFHRHFTLVVAAAVMGVMYGSLHTKLTRKVRSEDDGDLQSCILHHGRHPLLDRVLFASFLQKRGMGPFSRVDDAQGQLAMERRKVVVEEQVLNAPDPSDEPEPSGTEEGPDRPKEADAAGEFDLYQYLLDKTG